MKKPSETVDRPLACHLMVDLFECREELLERKETGERLVIEAAARAGLKTVSVVAHQFHPVGYTAVALLSESHLAIHTWPERGAALIDVFSCGSREAVECAARVLIEELRPSRVSQRMVDRG